MLSSHSLGPGMQVLGALALASLCADCIAAQAHMTREAVEVQLGEMNAARERRNRTPMGPIVAHCQRCEAVQPVYRLR